jgi:hypothetical protein
MKTRISTVLGVVGLGLLSLVAACDPSKAELDKTKADLATLTGERDNLKTQLEAANQKVGQLTQQVADLQAKAAAAAAPAAAAPAAEPKKEEKPAKHAASKKAPSPAEQKKIEAVEKKANTGAGHF